MLSFGDIKKTVAVTPLMGMQFAEVLKISLPEKVFSDIQTLFCILELQQRTKIDVLLM